MPISRLDPHVVNQIAAGEVVERPSSVVKELVENALDAGATRIQVLTEGGGIDRIQIIDDGCGIAPDELELAVAAHATSKVARLEDLDHIATMGFRGEALASIGSVARLEIRSRLHDQDRGARILVDNGHTNGAEPSASVPGTTVTVESIFSRVPARRKFLKSAQSETNRTRRVLRDLAAANPETAILFSSGGRVLMDLAPSDWRGRLDAILGDDVASSMLEVHSERDGIALTGLIGLPDVARPTARAQVLCLNGRPIVDARLRHAVREAYRGLMEPGRHPTVMLFLTINPDRVDVNVHPAKTEVRFRDDRLVYSVVRRALEQALDEAELIRALPVVALEDAPTSPGPGPRLFGSSASPGPGSGSFPVESVRQAVEASATLEAAPIVSAPVTQRVLQVHRSYLVTEDDEGLVIIDQHALHERVMFQQLLARIGGEPLPSQRLLVPDTLDASPEAIEALEDLSGLLDRLGFDITPSGPGTVAVHAVPSLLAQRKVGITAFVGDLIERAGDLRDMTDDETALRDILDMMACKAAVKAGDELTPRELSDLLAMREQVERASNCPHGRPTSLRLSLEDLERRFGRS